MRPSQCTHKTWQKETVVGGGRRRLTKVPRHRNCQKSGEGKLGEDRWRDGSARQHRTSLEMESRRRKVGHTPTRAGA